MTTKDKIIKYRDIEIELIRQGIQNHGKLEKYIGIDVPSITWLTIAQTRTFARKLLKAADELEKME